MIRTMRSAPFFSFRREPAVLHELAQPAFLTTARYEPILYRQLGSGQLDLLFETARQCCVIDGLRLDPAPLITRERSALIWPAQIADLVEPTQLYAIERMVTPWLRAMARARSMSSESIRHFAQSDRFERAREAQFVGAAPLCQTIPRMAPFVYARRFCRGARVTLACADSALAELLLADLAATIERAEPPAADDTFEREWYGIRASRIATDSADVTIVTPRGDRSHGLIGDRSRRVIIETGTSQNSEARIIDVPSPAPWDLLFPFDAGDAPVVSRFGVQAPEPPLREAEPPGPQRIIGGSSGSIVFALGSEASTARGPDVEDMNRFAQRLVAEGLDVVTVTQTSDPALDRAQLIHIFGDPYESHTVAFAELASARGIDYVFDVPPKPASPSAFLENMFPLINRSALDDVQLRNYQVAYEQGYLTPVVPEPTADDYARMDARFGELAGGAVAVLGDETDIAALATSVPEAARERLAARGYFGLAEPVAAAIGHLVPNVPFAFVHGSIAARSHSLYVAVAANQLGIPLVIAGALYDVEYLQTLRGCAPDAIILVDPDPHVVSALYRLASVWVDAAPRPRSAAALMRAVACGALPVVAAESPLARIAGPAAPTFSLYSLDEGSRVLGDALGVIDREARIALLRERLSDLYDPTLTFAGLMTAYARAATPV